MNTGKRGYPHTKAAVAILFRDYNLLRRKLLQTTLGMVEMAKDDDNVASKVAEALDIDKMEVETVANIEDQRTKESIIADFIFFNTEEPRGEKRSRELTSSVIIRQEEEELEPYPKFHKSSEQ